jgi:hypothetical protein
MCAWFQPQETADRAYLARIGRLKSELNQSRTGVPNPELDNLMTQLDALENAHPSDNEVLAVQRIEGELCLYKPLVLLYPTYLRLTERFYRFDPDRRAAWQADLKRLMPDASTVKEENTVRQRLRQLTLELYEEAESYSRTALEKSRVIRNLTAAGIALLAVLILFEWLMISYALQNAPTFKGWLSMSLLAGAIGAATSLLSSIGSEKVREEYFMALLVQMAVRTLIGIVYALVVYAGVSSDTIPIRVPSGLEKEIAFYILLGFFAGFSDKLFGQTLRQFLAESGGSGSKAKSKAKGS